MTSCDVLLKNMSLSILRPSVTSVGLHGLMMTVESPATSLECSSFVTAGHALRADDRLTWVQQVRAMHALYRLKESQFWSNRIAASTGNSKKL
jgi:hypothetical protein